MNYFYAQKTKSPPYLALPLFLLEDTNYRSLSSGAKLLYGMLLRRVDLSRKNGWIDAQGRVYLFYPITEVMELLGCCKQKAVNTLRELEVAGLLERESQGQGKPSKILPKTPVAVYESDSYLSIYEEALMQIPVL